MNVVSILNVVESVASQVPTPEECIEGFVNRNEVAVKPFITRDGRVIYSESMHGLRMGFLNGAFLSAYRYSQAAGALDYHLDGSGNETPLWRDSGPTGWYKVSATARQEGLAILVHMSRYFDRYREAFLSGRLDDWPRRNFEDSEGLFSHPLKQQRSKEICFDRDELLIFLNRIGIPHTLGDVSILSDFETQVIPDDIALTPCTPLFLVMHSDVIENQSESVALASTPAAKYFPVREHVLDTYISDAQTEAGHHAENPSVVYSILVKMAKAGKHLPVLIGVNAEKEFIYLSASGEKPYTKSALGKYIRAKKNRQLAVP